LENIAQIGADEGVGIPEVTLQWFDMDGAEGLEVFAPEVHPHVTQRSSSRLANQHFINQPVATRRHSGLPGKGTKGLPLYP